MGCYQTKKKNLLYTQNSINPQIPTSIKGDQFLFTPQNSDQTNPNLINQEQFNNRSHTEFEQLSSRKYTIQNSPQDSQYFKQVRNLGYIDNSIENNDEKNKAALLQNILTQDVENINSFRQRQKPKIDDLIDHLRKKRESEKRKSRYSIQYLQKII